MVMVFDRYVVRAQPALGDNLCLHLWGGRGVMIRTRCWKKRHLHRLTDVDLSMLPKEQELIPEY